MMKDRTLPIVGVGAGNTIIIRASSSARLPYTLPTLFQGPASQSSAALLTRDPCGTSTSAVLMCGILDEGRLWRRQIVDIVRPGYSLLF